MLFVFAVTLHNLPEGLAVGIGFGTGDLIQALVLMFAIGIQNIPEGLAVGFLLVSTEKYSRKKSFLYAFLSDNDEKPCDEFSFRSFDRMFFDCNDSLLLIVSCMEVTSLQINIG